MVAFWHYGRLLVTLKAARPTCQSLPEPEHWCARLKIVMTFLDWKEIHCLWSPYSMISIKTTLAWHKDIWVSQCSPKMPFILKILPLSLSPFKSKILECFYTMERDYLKEANPLTFDRHHRHVIINLIIIINMITIIIARSVLPGGDGDLNGSCRSRSGSLHGRLSEVLHLSFLIEYSHP